MAAVTKPEDVVASTTTVPVVQASPKIGSILNKAMDDVEAALTAAANKAHHSVQDVLTTGMQTFSLISNVKARNTENLNITYENASKAVKDDIDAIKDVVQAITTGEPSKIQTAAEKVKSLAVIYKMDLLSPFVADISSRFIAVSPGTTKTSIVISGKFPYGERQDCAVLRVNGKDFRPSIGSDQQQLKFDVEISSDVPKLDKHKYTYLNADLKVSYNVQGWPWSWEASSHKVLLGMQPTTPGSFKVLFTTPAEVVHKNNSTGPIKAEQTRLPQTRPLKADEGWRLTPGSATTHWLELPKNECWAKIAANGTSYQYHNKDGEGTFKIDFSQEQEIPEKTRTEEFDTLQWGTNLVIEPKEKEKISEITLTRNDGSQVKFGPSSNTSDPHIELRTFESSIQIRAKTADALNTPAAAPKLTTEKEITISKSEGSDIKADI